jgi:hypothetical protein
MAKMGKPASASPQDEALIDIPAFTGENKC